jgi:hypothetical protein
MAIVDRAEKRERPPCVVKVPGQPANELSAMPAMRQVLLGLAFLIGIGVAGGVRLQNGLAVGAPLPLL